MANARDITLDIIGKDSTKPATSSAAGNLDKLRRSADRAGTAGNRMRDKFKAGISAVAPLAQAAGTALAAFGAYAVKAASDLEQSTGGAQAVFGKFSDQVVSKSKAAAQAYGLSQDQYLTMSNQLGALLKNQGVAADQLAGKTDKLVSLGADLAATYGGTAADAVEALTAAYKGEFDPLEKYGVTLSAATVAQELARTGQDKLTGAALAAAKQQATTNLIYRQGGDALGQFAAQQGTTAEQTQIARAQFTNLSAQLGSKLLPVINRLLTAGLKFLAYLQKNPAAAYALAAAVAVLAGGVLALNLAFLASPVGLVVAGLAAIAAAVVYAYKRSETFRTVVNAVFKAAANVVLSMASTWIGAFGSVFGILGKLPGKAGAAFRSAERAADQAKAKVDGLRSSLNAVKSKRVKITVDVEQRTHISQGISDHLSGGGVAAGHSAGSTFARLENALSARTGGPAVAPPIYLDGSTSVYLDSKLIASVARREATTAVTGQAWRARTGRR